MTNKSKIEDFDCCPHCGDDFGYYQNVNYRGSYEDTYLFENRQPYNHAMWDSAIETFRSKNYYCKKCQKPICKV